jgi:hypothetical protein
VGEQALSGVPGILLRINAAQVAAMEVHVERRFVDRLIDDAHSNDARGAGTHQVSREGLRTQYQAWLSDARALGFSTEYELSVFARCCELFGEDFHKRPELEPAVIIAMPGKSSARKARHLAELCDAHR